MTVFGVAPEMERNGMTSDYARALGARLRAIRTQQGLSLHGVEKKSKGRWKAVVVGSYERGDYNNKVLSIRGEDLRSLSIIYDLSEGELTERLIEWGVLAPDARSIDPALDRRHQAGDAGDRRDDPGAAVRLDGREGQGRHPRRALPRPSLGMSKTHHDRSDTP